KKAYGPNYDFLPHYNAADQPPPIVQHNVAEEHPRPQALTGSRRNSAVENQLKTPRTTPTLSGGQPCPCHKAAASSAEPKQHTCDREFWDTPTISLRQTGPRDQLPVRPLLRGAMQYLQTAHSRRSSPTAGMTSPYPDAYQQTHIHPKHHWRSEKKTTQKTKTRETAQTHHEDNVRQEAPSQKSSQVPRGSRERRAVACGGGNNKEEANRIRPSQTSLATAKARPSNSTATTWANLGRYGHNYDEVDVLLYNLCLNIESAL
ncbi:unnamed protein product, partial [Dibothriocephalus latus]